MGAQSKPSQQEAENFHVLPKDKAAKQQTPSSTSGESVDHVATRDAEAGSLIGISNTGDAERLTTEDRSKVS